MHLRWAEAVVLHRATGSTDSMTLGQALDGWDIDGPVPLGADHLADERALRLAEPFHRRRAICAMTS